MKAIRKLPGVSFLLMVGSYITIGWLLSLYKADWRVWLISGAVAQGTNPILAIAWVIGAIFVVFRTRPDTLPMAIGICTVWSLLMYIAHSQFQVYIPNRSTKFIVLALLRLSVWRSVGMPTSPYYAPLDRELSNRSVVINFLTFSKISATYTTVYEKIDLVAWMKNNDCC